MKDIKPSIFHEEIEVKFESPQPIFELGPIHISDTALEMLTIPEVDTALERHASGDSGDVAPDDEVLSGDTHLSVYHARERKGLMIVTQLVQGRPDTRVCLLSDVFDT